jgi:hypothetical protein
MRHLILAAAVVACPAAARDQASELNLICVGGGSANKATSGTVTGWNTSGEFASGTIRSSRSVGFEDKVGIRIAGEEGRLRMPRTMLPPIRGGEDGWFKLKNIEYSDGEITASVSVNPLNNPKLRLDRDTGAVSLSGKAGDFVGQCQKFDPATTARQF